MPRRLRFTAEKIIPLQTSLVDRHTKVIHDVIGMSLGRSRDSRNMGVDEITLEMMADLGNAKPRGILQRFGHPGASENAMGKQVARATNFRVRGGHLIHDSHLLDHSGKSPVFAQDPTQYLMDMAEDNPGDIMESVVIMTDQAWVLKDGTEQPYWTEDEDGFLRKTKKPNEEDLKYEYPVLRPTKFYNVDYVMEGALTDSLTASFMREMFSGTVHEDLMDMFMIADDAIQRYNIPIEVVPDKIEHVANAYLAQLGLNRRLTMTRQDKQAGVVPPVQDDAPPQEAPTVEKPQSAGPSTEDLQKQIDAMQASLDQQQDEDTVTITRDEYDQLQQDVASMRDEMAQFRTMVGQLVQSMQTLNQNHATLNNKVHRLNNEPQVKVDVPKQAGFQMQEWMTQASPTHVTQRPYDQSTQASGDHPVPIPESGDPALITLANSISRKASQTH